MTGIVYLVGAGPGAPDLITIRGAEVLARADIVFFDALVHPQTLALAGRARKVSVGKRCGEISTDQRFINRNLVEASTQYSVVVRLKGGDPMLFGRAQEEIAALEQHGIRYEIVPGVTAALAASAELAIPLTQRGLSRSVTFSTARVGVGQAAADWARAVSATDTAALYMSRGDAAEISATLQAHGMPSSTPVAIVANASLQPCKHIRTTLVDLSSAIDCDMKGPAILLLGEVFRERVVSKGDTLRKTLEDSPPVRLV
ncbi:uroporphyrin-III C-methyltransferase [Sulfuriferula plumbiphila]|uniref:uroporphyrinogen-III C-methyltransferase n=1 Tax=Sulfuriferula plumbiphila TaxID=171865 RepID=A0A512LB87_9PROT|nr:uroporphyrinogen-III C-methyltransferase [Sulfuriferula plumbiphila]BBP04447.1 uroporphyrin-III C-methyltransferase [Sulfuriferula plumbiphila]GEP31749.1 uroporphyrin-III C-methyltransferase [Sulfuriferula plumbiphila]